MNIKDLRAKINSKVLFAVAFLFGIILIFSTYAWLSQTLNVKVKFFDLQVQTDNGLFISLDGVEYSDTVEISLDSIITDLEDTYPTNTNQWASSGLWSVSSNGIPDSNSDKFNVFFGEVNKKTKNSPDGKRFLNTKQITETRANKASYFIAFDIFLKNVSGSPKPDNLYLSDGTSIDFEDGTDIEVKDAMANIMDSIRFGIVRIASTLSTEASAEIVQNLECNDACEMVIFEPNNLHHTELAIERAANYGVTMVDGVAMPTYGVIAEGNYLAHTNGQEGTGIPLDTEHFALQETITNYDNPIFKMPNGITKLRIYVWIEGQDIDSLETYSKGSGVYLSIDFEKDLAGYEE